MSNTKLCFNCESKDSILGLSLLSCNMIFICACVMDALFEEKFYNISSLIWLSLKPILSNDANTHSLLFDMHHKHLSTLVSTKKCFIRLVVLLRVSNLEYLLSSLSISSVGVIT